MGGSQSSSQVFRSVAPEPEYSRRRGGSSRRGDDDEGTVTTGKGGHRLAASRSRPLPPVGGGGGLVTQPHQSWPSSGRDGGSRKKPSTVGLHGGAGSGGASAEPGRRGREGVRFLSKHAFVWRMQEDEDEDEEAMYAGSSRAESRATDWRGGMARPSLGAGVVLDDFWEADDSTEVMGDVLVRQLRQINQDASGASAEKVGARVREPANLDGGGKKKASLAEMIRRELADCEERTRYHDEISRAPTRPSSSMVGIGAAA